MGKTLLEKTTFCEKKKKKSFEFYAPATHPLPSTGFLHKQRQDCEAGAWGQLGGEMMGLKQQHSWEALLNKGFCSALAGVEVGWIKIVVNMSINKVIWK